MIQIKKARRSKKTTEVEALAKTLEPELKKAFMTAVKRKQDSVVLINLSEAVSTGTATNFVGDLQILDIKDAVTNHYKKSADLAISQLPASIQGKIQFDLLNPETVNHINQYTANLVTQINSQMRQSIQTVVENGYLNGKHPYEIAERIKSLGIGIDSRQASTLMKFEDNLLASGATKAEVKIASKSFYNKMLKTRTEKIARTEALAATNGGQQTLWSQAQADGLLDGAKKFWLVTSDDRTSDVCTEAASLNNSGVDVNQPFDTPSGQMLSPPQHPNCRCVSVIRFNNTEN